MFDNKGKVIDKVNYLKQKSDDGSIRLQGYIFKINIFLYYFYLLLINI